MIDAFVRRHLSRTLAARMLVALTVAGLSASANELGAQSNPVTARDAWVREAPAGRVVTGVFVTVENSGAAPRKIVSGKASVGDTLELHEMKREGGMMQMSPVREIAVPANGKVELRPGGLHLMLFGLKKPLVPGDTVRVELTLDDGSRVSVAAPVRKMGQM
jgi:copper(I)-binding protein